MLPIFIISSKPKLVEPIISGSLGTFGSVMRCSQKSICVPSASDFVVFSAQSHEQFDADKGIAVLYEPAPRKAVLSYGITPILLSSDRRAIKLVKGLGNPSICCGCSATDSITMSSRSNGKLLVSLQRELPNAHGGIIEPAEYSFSDPGGDVQKLLLCAAVLISAGCSDTGEICTVQ